MKLSYKKVIYVGFAFLLIQAFWIAYDAIVPLMLVNKFGMNHTLSGLIMALDNILAIFLLPLFGTLSDKCRSKMGKRKPFVLIGTVLAAVAFFGLSFVDYAQFKNLGEQVQMPGQYSVTEASQQAQQYFWEHDYAVHNNEYSLTGGGNNEIGESVALHDYVAEILYDKPYSELSEGAKNTCREWYSGLTLSSAYIYSEGKFTVYRYNGDGTELYLQTFAEDGSITEIPAPLGEAKSVNSSNAYSVLVSGARSVYAAEVTKNNPATITLFMVVLFVTLFSMAVFRSPAVALMPDVVIRQERSKGNAVINLMGMLGGILILGAGMAFGTDKVANQIMSYMGYIGCVCAVMIISLVIFMVKVKEPKWAAEMAEDQKRADGEREDKPEGVAEKPAQQPSTGLRPLAEIPLGRTSYKKEKSFSEGPSCKDTEALVCPPEKKRLGGAKLASLMLLLFSVAFWYMGYNAITSKYSLYSINVLGKPYNLVLIVAQVVAIVAFLPIGMLSEKIGRKFMILVGVAMLAGAFGGAYFIKRSSPDWLVYVLFAVAGVGWASINVNSFPMVVELASEGDVGKYTGYYYTASMAAQIITPTLSGFIMDSAGTMSPLFLYGTFFVVLSFITMCFVRHGDSKPQRKKSALEYLEGGD